MANYFRPIPLKATIYNRSPSSSDSEYQPQLVRDLVDEDSSYSEKLALIAQEIHRTTLVDAHRPTGYNDLKDLSQHLKHFIGVSGEELADLMGFRNFRAMCLNSAEIANLHTWKFETNKQGQKIVSEFRANIPKEHQMQVDAQPKETAAEKTADSGDRVIKSTIEKGLFPTDEELQFRYRMCQSLDSLDGRRKFIRLGAWIRNHSKVHKGEEMNSESYRKFFKLPSQINIQSIIKDRFQFEIMCVESKDKNCLEFKLLHSLEEIRKYHVKVRRARDEYFLKLELEAKLKMEQQAKRDNEFNSCINFE